MIRQPSGGQLALRDIALGVVVGLGVGLVAGWGLGRPGEPAAVVADPAAPVAVAAAPVHASASGARSAPGQPPADLAELVAAQDAQIRQLSEIAFGRPLVWPDGAAQALEREIAATLDACDESVRLIGADCSEPPCLVTLDLGVPSNKQILERCPTMKDRMGFRGYSTFHESCPDGSKRQFMVLSVGQEELYRAANPGSDEDFSENESTRVRVRTEDTQDTFACPE